MNPDSLELYRTEIEIVRFTVTDKGPTLKLISLGPRDGIESRFTYSISIGNSGELNLKSTFGVAKVTHDCLSSIEELIQKLTWDNLLSAEGFSYLLKSKVLWIFASFTIKERDELISLMPYRSMIISPEQNDHEEKIRKNREYYGLVRSAKKRFVKHSG